MGGVIDFSNLSQFEREQLTSIVSELARRRAEALALYEPLPLADRFHVSKKRNRLGRGSNRSAKTLTCAMEVGRAITGTDPYDKWPKVGRGICVGKDEREIAEVMYRKLFRAGAFKIIWDERLSKWRTFKPWQKWDKENAKKAKPAPPIIPQRFIKSIAWKNKKKSVPDKVIFKNGWELIFVSSAAKPMKGADVDLVWFDEEIQDGLWYEEMQARLFDREGLFMWSVTPEAATEQLYALHERADAGDPDVEEFHFRLADNPYFSEGQKRSFAASLSRHMARAKVDGEYLMHEYLVFSDFDEDLHTCEPFPIPEPWSLYMSVDPGRQVCAVLFFAVPPPEDPHAGTLWVYDGLYIEQATATKFGQAVKPKADAKNFELFMIDPGSACTADLGSGKNVQMQYAEALAHNKIESNRTGSNFLWGTSDVKGGIEAIRKLFEMTPSGRPGVQIFRNCDSLIYELKHYHYKRDRQTGKRTDKPVDKNDHAIWCLQAMAAYRPQYVRPKKRVYQSPAYKAFLAKKARQREQFGGPFVQLGSPV